MTTPLDAKVAFHLALATAALGRPVKPEDFDRALADGYGEIERLFADEAGKAQRTNVTAALEQLAAVMEPCHDIDCPRDHHIHGGTLVHAR